MLSESLTSRRKFIGTYNGLSYTTILLVVVLEIIENLGT